MARLLTALVVVFVSELGDKSLLVALGLGARYRLRAVIVGLALAYSLANLVSVAVGGLLGSTLPTRPLGFAAGLLFLGFACKGAYDLKVSAGEPVMVSGEAQIGPSSGVGFAKAVASVAVTVFLAELGDKTMLSTAALATDGSYVQVWIGSTLGIFLAGFVAVMIGRWLGSRFPERSVRTVSVILFAVVGVAMVIAAAS